MVDFHDVSLLSEQERRDIQKMLGRFGWPQPTADERRFFGVLSTTPKEIHDEDSALLFEHAVIVYKQGNRRAIEEITGALLEITGSLSEPLRPDPVKKRRSKKPAPY